MAQLRANHVGVRSEERASQSACEGEVMDLERVVVGVTDLETGRRKRENGLGWSERA